jgi:hypothetical protein
MSGEVIHPTFMHQIVSIFIYNVVPLITSKKKIDIDQLDAHNN